MLYYRLYFLNDTGRIYRVRELDADGDDSAVSIASQYQGEEPLELWCQHRRVQCFESINTELRSAQ